MDNPPSEDRQVRGNDINPKTIGAREPPESVNAESLVHNPATDISASIGSAISSGLVVGIVPDASIVTKPSAKSSHDVAVQEAVNHVEGKSSGGVVHVPAVADDGTQFTVENTITTDNNDATPVGFIIHSYSSNADITDITTTINDGSPMFHVRGIDGGNNVANAPFICYGANLGGNDAGLVKFTNCLGMFPRFGRVTSYAGDAVEFNNSLNGAVMSGNFLAGNNTAVGVKLTDSDAIGIMPSCMFGRTHRDCILADGGDNGGRVAVGAVLAEGADGTNGTAAIVRSINGTKLIVTPNFRTGPTSNGAHGIFADGTSAIIQPANVSPNIDGDGVRTGSTINEFIIGTKTLWGSQGNSIGGDMINVTTAPNNSAQCVVPYEDNVRGPVSYPSGRWFGIYYPDGRQRSQEGTLTLTGGAGTGDGNVQTTRAFNVGNQKTSFTVQFRAQDPDFDADYAYAEDVPQHAEYIESKGTVELIVRTYWTIDPGSNNDVDLDYRVIKE